MEISSVNALKRQLYAAVTKTVREQLSQEQTKQEIKEKYDRIRLEHITDPTKGLMVDLFA